MVSKFFYSVIGKIIIFVCGAFILARMVYIIIDLVDRMRLSDQGSMLKIPYVIVIIMAFTGGAFILAGMIHIVIGLVDDMRTPEQFRRKAKRRVFLGNFVALTTAIMKADGNIKLDELGYAQSFFHENLGKRRAEKMTWSIRDVLSKEIDVEEVCLYFRDDVSVPLRVQSLYLFFGVARASGNMNASNMALLDRIVPLLGLSDTTYRSIKSMFHEESDSAYTILGISSTATDEEVKKAYLRATIMHRPNKIEYMGKNIRRAAEKKFAAINAAYEKIKRDRGL
jgi:DnaJ like chaperone protein